MNYILIFRKKIRSYDDFKNVWIFERKFRIPFVPSVGLIIRSDVFCETIKDLLWDEHGFGDGEIARLMNYGHGFFDSAFVCSSEVKDKDPQSSFFVNNCWQAGWSLLYKPPDKVPEKT